MRRLDAIVKYLGIPEEEISPPGFFSVIWRDGIILLESRSYADCLDYMDAFGDSFVQPPMIVSDDDLLTKEGTGGRLKE